MRHVGSFSGMWHMSLGWWCVYGRWDTYHVFGVCRKLVSAGAGCYGTFWGISGSDWFTGDWWCQIQSNGGHGIQKDRHGGSVGLVCCKKTNLHITGREDTRSFVARSRIWNFIIYVPPTESSRSLYADVSLFNLSPSSRSILDHGLVMRQSHGGNVNSGPNVSIPTHAPWPEQDHPWHLAPVPPIDEEHHNVRRALTWDCDKRDGMRSLFILNADSSGESRAVQ